MERPWLVKVFELKFRSHKIRLGIDLRAFDEEPEIKPRFTGQRPPGVTPLRESNEQVPPAYLPYIAEGYLIIRTNSGMKVKIDPNDRVVHVNGSVEWVGTNFGGVEYGWKPDNVSFQEIDQRPNLVDWKVQYSLDKFQNLHVAIYHPDKRHPLELAINAGRRYVIVWDAAVRALLKGGMFTVGPDRPLPQAFREMKANQQPKIVEMEHFRSG